MYDMLVCCRVHRFHLHIGLHSRFNAFVEPDIGLVLRSQYRQLKAYMPSHNDARWSNDSQHVGTADERLQKLTWNELMAICNNVLAEMISRAEGLELQQQRVQRRKTVIQVLQYVRPPPSFFVLRNS